MHLSAKVLVEHPGQSALVMSVIASWAHIDTIVSATLADLMKADFEVLTDMYQSLSGGAAKKSAFLAAARSALPEWQFILVQAVLKATKPSREQRNDFAHHVWGTCKEVPDALLLVHPASSAASDLFFRSIREGEPPVQKPGHHNGYDLKRIFVYKDADLLSAAKDAAEAGLMFGRLQRVISPIPPVSVLPELLSDPRIQQALQPLTRESSLEVREQLRLPSADEAQTG